MAWNSGATQTGGSSAPWKAQQPYLKQAFADAQSLYATGGPQQYAGSTIAGYGSGTRSAMQGLADYWGVANPGAPTQVGGPSGTGGIEYGADTPANAPAGGGLSQGQQFIDSTTKARNFGLEGVLDPDSNKYLQAAARAAIRPVTENLQENILPGIQSSAVIEGGYGGNRQGIAEGVAIGKANQQALDTTSSMYSNAYNRGLDTFENTMGQLPQLLNLEQSGVNAQATLGSMQDQLAQSLLEEQANKYWQTQIQPYQNLEQYLNFISGAYGSNSSGFSDTVSGLQSGGGLLGQLGKILGL